MPTPNYICGRKRIRAMFETDLSVPFVVQIFDVRPRQVDGLCQRIKKLTCFTVGKNCNESDRKHGTRRPSKPPPHEFRTAAG